MTLNELAPINTYPLVARQSVDIEANLTIDHTVFFEKVFVASHDQRYVEHARILDYSGRVIFDIVEAIFKERPCVFVHYLLKDGQLIDGRLVKVNKRTKQLEEKLTALNVDTNTSSKWSLLLDDAPWQSCVDPRLE